MSAPGSAGLDQTPLVLRAVRGFHVGGKTVVLRDQPVGTLAAVPGGPARRSDPNGHYLEGVMYFREGMA